jgi:CrcB protein
MIARPAPKLIWLTLLVALGGGLGACSRWGIELLVTSAFTSPAWTATLAVNLSGCVAIGFFFTWLDPRFPQLTNMEVQAAELPGHHHWVGGLAITGFIGAYTTYSSFSLDTLRLIESGQLGWAALSVALSLTAGLLAVGLGIRLGHHAFNRRAGER